MRQTTTALSIALIVLGLEMSTRAASLAIGRLGAGFDALFAGLEFHVGSVRFVAGVAVLVLGFGIAGLNGWLGWTERRVSNVGDRCPQCGSGTHRVKRRRTHRILSTIMGRRLTRRHCEHCSWSGLSVRY